MFVTSIPCSTSLGKKSMYFLCTIVHFSLRDHKIPNTVQPSAPRMHLYYLFWHRKGSKNQVCHTTRLGMKIIIPSLSPAHETEESEEMDEVDRRRALLHKAMTCWKAPEQAKLPSDKGRRGTACSRQARRVLGASETSASSSCVQPEADLVQLLGKYAALCRASWPEHPTSCFPHWQIINNFQINNFQM